MPTAVNSSEEFDIGVTFYADDFVLTVLVTTDADVDDETRIAAAAEWFADTHGFNPTDHATRSDVKRIEEVPPQD